MRRTGRVIFILFILLSGIVGLWLFQGWMASKRAKTAKTIHNVYILKADDKKLYGIDKKEETWSLASNVQGGIKAGIADIYMEEDQVVKIVQKPDVLKGKILKIDSNCLQVEEYGRVMLDDNFQLFHVDANGTVTAGKKEELLVGYTDVQYVVAGDKICAALLEQTKLANIRVLLSENANKEYDMQEVVVSATTDYAVNIGGKLWRYPAEQRQIYHFDDVDNRIIIAATNNGKIRIENLKRQCGVPEYRGKIEIEKVDKSLHVINEVDLEQYLYSVVPSEMPTEYPLEALKAQAICARSYALQQMRGKRLANLGAHVDDSVGFQVYNNLKEDEQAIKAVNETKSLVVSENNKLVPTYFYSVSSGCSEGIKDVWFAKKDTKYLPVKWQGEQQKEMNLSNEKTFEQFIKEDGGTYDSGSPWYRWQTTRSLQSIQEQLTQRLRQRYKANPTQIQTKQKDGSYHSDGNVDIGTLKSLKIVERGTGGVVRILEVEGSKETIQVYSEYNIRYLLGDEKAVFMRKDKKEVTGVSMLPSGFFTIEKDEKGYKFVGGGYGHGVGMSQYGAKTMAENGKNYQDILTFYFSGTLVSAQETLG